MLVNEEGGGAARRAEVVLAIADPMIISLPFSNPLRSCRMREVARVITIIKLRIISFGCDVFCPDVARCRVWQSSGKSCQAVCTGVERLQERGQRCTQSCS
jgi:hypothetical protein